MDFLRPGGEGAEGPAGVEMEKNPEKREVGSTFFSCLGFQATDVYNIFL